MYLTIWWSGVEIAKLYCQGKPITSKNLKLCIMVLTVITIVLAVNVYISEEITTIGVHPLLELRHFAFSLIAILIATLWKKVNWFGFSWIDIFSRIAPISYGIYISHYFLISNATYLDKLISNSILRYSIYIMICLGFSYFIEKVVYTKFNKLIFKLAT